jgi:hypothetical protein
MYKNQNRNQHVFGTRTLKNTIRRSPNHKRTVEDANRRNPNHKRTLKDTNRRNPNHKRILKNTYRRNPNHNKNPKKYKHRLGKMHAISLLRAFLSTSEQGQTGDNAKKDEKSSGRAGGGRC